MKKNNVFTPDLPESINEATVIKWHKKIGDTVFLNENIVDIETDKIILEVTSPCDGILQEILENEGNIVKSQQILGIVHQKNISKKSFNNKIIEKKENISEKNTKLTKHLQEKKQYLTPSMRRLLHSNNALKDIVNIKNETQINFFRNQMNINKEDKNILIKNDLLHIKEKNSNKNETRIPMSALRKKIQERLLYSQKNTATLTTFNEVNMKEIILLRKKYKDIFEKTHGVKIGFMSFFVKAVVQSLKKFPKFNASIDQNEIVYYKNFHINIAVSTSRGLIAPVLQNADHLSMPQIEKKIKEFSMNAEKNKINITDLTGGQFTITNGGVFGSLISTPIINPPQVAILGIHKIQDRAIVVDGKIEILPMMYLALSYDHCLIDGKESVNFLISIKNILEDFNRILIDV